MKHKTYSWTSGDKKTIFAQSWKPEVESDKTILFVHGLGEHSGRYQAWAEGFTNHGYNCLAIDLHGHGKSDGKRGHAKSISTLLDDIDLMFDKVSRLFPGNKIILYGHSMGGNLVLNHVIRRNRAIDALIVTSPWLKLYKEPSYATMLMASIGRKFFPSLTVPTPLSADQLSHDPEVGRLYTHDKLVHNKISLRLFFELYESGIYAMRNVYKINYPFLIMHGTDDTITSPRASKNYVMNTGKRTRLKMWEGQYHELHNEFIKEEVQQYILSWLNEYKL